MERITTIADQPILSLAKCLNLVAITRKNYMKV